MNIISTIISWDGSALEGLDLRHEAAAAIGRLVGAPTKWKVRGSTFEVRWKTQRVKAFAYELICHDVDVVEDEHCAIWCAASGSADVACSYGLPRSWHLPRSIFD